MTATAMNLVPSDRDAQLAAELAMQLAPTADILDRYGISVDDLKFKLSNTQFRQMYQETKRTWESGLSSEERIKLKARMLVEDSLLRVFALIHSEDTPSTARIEAFKQLTKVAGVDQQQKTGDAGNRVSITLNIGKATRPITIDAIAQQLPGGLHEVDPDEDD